MKIQLSCMLLPVIVCLLTIPAFSMEIFDEAGSELSEVYAYMLNDANGNGSSIYGTNADGSVKITVLRWGNNPACGTRIWGNAIKEGNVITADMDYVSSYQDCAQDRHLYTQEYNTIWEV